MNRFASRTLFLTLVGVCAACTGGPALLRRGSAPEPVRADTLYWEAVSLLDAANKQGSLDSALVYLERYLATGATQPHRTEALVLRQLARNSQQLARVEAALQHARATATDTKSRTEPEQKARDEEMVKEIQRLKDELAKANEELERIKKRLATPKPPSS